MKPRELFAQVGRALFGDRWKADIEHALKIRRGRADDWSKGHGEPAPGVWLELARLIEARREMLPGLQAVVLTFASRPAPRIYECANGRKFSVKAGADGSYPEVQFQDGTGFWEVLLEGQQTVPPRAIAYRIKRGEQISNVQAIVSSDAQSLCFHREGDGSQRVIKLRPNAEKD